MLATVSLFQLHIVQAPILIDIHRRRQIREFCPRNLDLIPLTQRHLLPMVAIVLLCPVT